MSDTAIRVENLSKLHPIGSGRAAAILDVARLLCDGTGLNPHVSAAARVGDIRHCTADNAAAGSAFGYAPAVGLATGLGRLIADGAYCKPLACGTGTAPVRDLAPVARRELAQAGLLR